jgi:hypothetical protein
MVGDTPIDNLTHLGVVRGSLYYAQRLMPFAPVRRAVARAAASLVNLRRRHEAEKLETALGSRELGYVHTLRNKGWARLDLSLEPDLVSSMLAHLNDKELVANDGRRFMAQSPPSDVLLGSFPIRTVLNCPAVIELMNRRDTLGIASQYLGCAPTISGLRIDWSRAGRTKGYVQNFHRDYDDWRFLKLFAYLTDVDDTTGPHEYVSGSHLDNGQFRATVYDAENLRDQYGADSLVRVHGRRGTMFMVDTWGIHRGNAPETGSRLLLQIQFSILPVLKFDYQPMKVDLPEGCSREANRLLVK